MKNALKFFVFTIASLQLGLASAITIDFNVIALDSSYPSSTINTGPYGSVEITENAANDIIFNFTLDAGGFNDLQPEFGIGKFFFNSANTVSSADVIEWDPSDWSLITNGNTSAGPVSFDNGGEGNKTQTLDFIIQKDGDSILDYIVLNDDGYLFGAHVQAFGGSGDDEASAWIYATPSPIPVPAAFWLFGTALIGFVGFSRRTKV